LLALLLLSLLAPGAFAADKSGIEKPAQSIDQLKSKIEKILKDTHTPGASVAIVRRDGPEWVAGIGIEDVASGRATTEDTLFRIGSVSKGFTSLSVLLLADQGKLSLEDPVHKLAPEVWFENRWEATDPVRVVHLLEHTAGWDDWHLREFAKQAPDSMGLREALDYDHSSRVSRWRPGTRMAYCNSGPPVAAFIVEKLAHQRFEDFVKEKLFGPIGMKTATYFEPPPQSATVLYHNDGKTPFPYWHILERPSGSINASAKDMAAYVQFYLNRGTVNGAQVVPAADIDRMEVPKSTWAAKDGLKAGYGLSNYWDIEDGFVYHGYDGGLDGGLTQMGYLPDERVGYFFSINSGSGDAFEKVGKAIRAYVTRNLQKPPLPSAVPLPSNASDYSGWYEFDSPRMALTRFLDRLFIRWVSFQDGNLLLSSLGTWKDAYTPVTSAQFRYAPKDGSSSPAATLALLTPNEEGRFFALEVGATMRQIPAWFAILELALTAFVLLAIASVIMFAPFWLLGGLSKKRRRTKERAVRVWPLVTVLILCAIIAIIGFGGDDALANFGSLTIWSAAFFLATVAFAFAAIASAIALWRTPAEDVRRGVHRFSIAVTAALLVATAYLAYWGMIGLRTWA
jgi:CubicO group peptidase (beta-lactamase class C family)